MKKILCTAVSALALAAIADGVNSTEFGVLTVPSSAKETIVSVPWLASGTGSNDVSVADLVLTAGLTAKEDGVEGDELRYYDGSNNWSSWILMKDDQGNKYWSTGGKTPAVTALACGKALLLVRPNDGRTNQFYIMGKPVTLSQGAGADLASGSTETEVFTLVAPPKTTNTLNANDDFTWTNLKAGKDRLILGDIAKATGTTSYVWSGVQWKDAKGGTTVLIPAGTGFWFASKDNTKTGKKVTWSK